MDSKTDKNEVRLTEDQIADFREAFSFFDKDTDGYVKTSELGLLVRSLNQNPTQNEIAQYIADVDPDGTGKFDFPEFISLMARNYKEIDAEEELLEAFRVLDKQNTGIIGFQELQHVLKQLGEKLSEAEAQELIKLGDTDSTGQIKYADLVRLLTTSYIN